MVRPARTFAVRDDRLNRVPPALGDHVHREVVSDACQMVDGYAATQLWLIDVGAGDIRPHAKLRITQSGSDNAPSKVGTPRAPEARPVVA
jgi:hypothetical protein